MHGQVNGVPSTKPVMSPLIVPFFVSRKHVKLVAACRARSIAVTSDNEVYEWGFTGSDGEQF
jgi:alpha-tubulin suppressor-like RCC1 family protein